MNPFLGEWLRVEEKDWGADLRKLSAGAALIALTLWLDQMQDASLQGAPESPKSVVLVTGEGEYNMNKRLDVFSLRQMEIAYARHKVNLVMQDDPICYWPDCVFAHMH
ncbi:hypothetical protein GUJ93_ZPchr0006g44961 [Zizania palustris]|uniref:Uncharacterized protein n=1 Tax=Zizania palustris TaxID=103762 RepID=A0A8J5SNJ8_ZIZPA|nr:hypothetical protein GUJ93_ZPchr0006g44961 [Zizania palustris]